MRAFITLLALSLAAVAAVPTNSNRIVGGELATIHQYPQSAALLYSSFGSSHTQECGGTIITARSVLSAAHCVYGDTLNNWRVRVGSSYASRGGTVHVLSSIVIHGSYNPRTFDNDIAILRVSISFVFNNYVAAGRLASSTYNLADNQPVWAIGWGTTTVGGFNSDHLRHVQIFSVNQAVCQSLYSVISMSVTNNMLCSGLLNGGGRDQCQGDSGSPLIHNGVVVGVYSWGTSCALSQYPSVNTRVSRFASWIQALA